MSVNLLEELKPFVEWTPDNLIMEMGRKGFISNLADKLGIKYASAERNVQGWKNHELGLKKGTRSNRAISSKSQEYLNEIGREATAGSHKIQLNGKLDVGGSPLKARDRKIDLDLNNDQWQDLLDAAENADDAWQVLADAYHVPIMELLEGTITIS